MVATRWSVSVCWWVRQSEALWVILLRFRSCLEIMKGDEVDKVLVDHAAMRELALVNSKNVS